MAETVFSPSGIKVRQSWIVHQTGLDLSEAPSSNFLGNEKDFAKLWKAWRADALPKVDFSKEFVLVVTAGENSHVKISAILNELGTLQISNLSTQRRSLGMTYVLAIVERNGVKAIGKTPLPD